MRVRYLLFLFISLFLFNGCSENFLNSADESAPSLSVSDISLDFGEYGNEQIISLQNTGSGSISWTVSENSEWLEVIPSTGTMTEEWDFVHARLNRENLQIGEYSTSINIHCDNGQEEILEVSMIVLPPQPEYFWRVYRKEIDHYHVNYRNPHIYTLPLNGHVEVSIDFHTEHQCENCGDFELELIIMSPEEYNSFMNYEDIEEYKNARHMTIREAGVHKLSTQLMSEGKEVVVVVDHSSRGWEYWDFFDNICFNGENYDLEAVFIPEGYEND